MWKMERQWWECQGGRFEFREIIAFLPSFYYFKTGSPNQLHLRNLFLISFLAILVFFQINGEKVPVNEGAIDNGIFYRTVGQTFIESMDADFDVVVMDTPPIGLVSETMDLIRFSDVNLYIVRQDYTHKRYLLMVNDLYANDQVDNIYAVFNGMKAGVDVYDFGGYNYGYGYNYSYMRKGNYGASYYDTEDVKPQNTLLKRILDRFRV